MNDMTKLLPIMLGVLFACCSASVGEENRPRAIVGAIRWDAWHGDAEGPASPGLAVERALGPKHWHYRLPFYAKVVGENKVEARANTQAIMDQEITYASNTQLDYWAFLTYDPTSSMNIGLRLYLSSPLKSKGKIMKKWNYASVPGNSNLFFHHFTLHHFTKFLNDQTSNAMFVYLRLLRPGVWTP